jgi:hypothetical protein
MNYDITLTLIHVLQALEAGNGKWHGSVSGIICAPIDKVWTI